MKQNIRESIMNNLRVLSIDPSGTGTSGMCFVNGQEKQFFSFQSRE
jgi:hypothetical protein